MEKENKNFDKELSWLDEGSLYSLPSPMERTKKIWSLRLLSLIVAWLNTSKSKISMRSSPPPFFFAGVG